jgi:hypothetical protein
LRAAREAADVADCGQEGRCRLHIHAVDHHQPQHLRPSERLLDDLPVERADLGVEGMLPTRRRRDLAEVAVDIQPESAHTSRRTKDLARWDNDNDGYVLSAHPG